MASRLHDDEVQIFFVSQLTEPGAPGGLSKGPN
jgi:hypothetical protein